MLKLNSAKERMLYKHLIRTEKKYCVRIYPKYKFSKSVTPAQFPMALND